MKPAPMPWILCGPTGPPESTAEVAGSRATMRQPGNLSLNTSPTPVIVPPVPTPVLPEVGSTITDSPGRMRPSDSAASIMASAMRSLTDPPGLNCSHLTHTSADGPAAIRRSCTSGVPPISSRTDPICGDACATRSPLNKIHVRLPVAAVDAERLAALAQVPDGDRVEARAHLLRQLLPDGRGDDLGAAREPLVAHRVFRRAQL